MGQKKTPGGKPGSLEIATPIVTPRPPRTRCLVVLQGNRWLELYGPDHLDVHVVHAPVVQSPHAEIAVERLVEAMLPWWARELYWPGSLRATACLYPWTPADMLHVEACRLAHRRGHATGRIGVATEGRIMSAAEIISQARQNGHDVVIGIDGRVSVTGGREGSALQAYHQRCVNDNHAAVLDYLGGGVYTPTESGRERGGSKSRGDSVATLLVNLATESTTLWHTTGHGMAYATTQADNHAEHWPVKGVHFRRWLARQYFTAEGKAASANAMADALAVIEGRALFDGESHSVHVRVAGHDGRIYLDLCDSQWRVVQIDAGGWRVVDNSPVRFRRAKGMLPLSDPVPGGNVDQLRSLVNIPDDDTWRLIVGWLVGVLRDRGPYPVLAIHGEQGAAKSTTARISRSIVDPSASPLRCEPKDPRDLMIAASNSWVIGLDNLSHVPTWLSDALCRLSTGGGFSTRTLYENDDETIFDAVRPVILNGISELADRSDLLDRCIIINLPQIPESRRRTERELDAAVDAIRGQVLGGLLDLVSTALRRIDSVTLPSYPRMADFTEWVVASRDGDLGFLSAYMANRDSANESVLSENPVATAIIALVDATEGEVIESPSSLLGRLEEVVDDRVKRSRTWPRSPRGLSSIIRRIAPNLRAAGVDVDFSRENRRRLIYLTRIVTETCVTCVTSVTDREIPGENATVPGDAKGDGDAKAASPEFCVTAENTLFSRVCDASDAGDAKSRTLSCYPESRERDTL